MGVKLLSLITVLLVAVSLAVPQSKVGGGAVVGGTTAVKAAVVSGRSIIFDGTDDYLTTSNSGTSVPSAQSGWRAMVRLRGLSSPGATVYIFRDSDVAVLVLRHDPSGTYGAVLAYVGNGTDLAGSVTLPAADCIVLVRSNPAGTEVTVEAWDLAGANHVGSQNSAATSAATNFQSRNFAMGAFQGGSNFFTGKIDKFLFITGAGTYNAAAPNVLTTTGDIMNWTFDSDNGNDTSGNGVNLTLNGSPAFENTP